MFIQLSKEDCTYLLNLINEIDLDTKFTERQRGYTIPKLQRIYSNPESARLAWQDVDYLLELIEDSGDLDVQGEETIGELYQTAAMVQNTLIQIKTLQEQRQNEQKDIESQREMRRLRRRPIESLQEKFQHTTSSVS